MSTKKAIKNTVFNWIDLIVSNIFSFILRSLVIRYLGTEILGVNATIVETINLLNMMEMGIQTSITYKIYKPIIEGDVVRQKELFNLFIIAYRIIGVAILLCSLAVSPFIPRIVNTSIEISIVYTAYFLQVGTIVLGYFVSYYGLLFVVYQKQYQLKIYNIALTTGLFFVRLIVLITTKNYLLYLSVTYLGILCTCVFYRVTTQKYYPEVIKKTRLNKNDVRQLLKDTKELLIDQAAGYVYGSTDNVLISYFFGSFTTGLISNYRLITGFIRNILSYAGNAISPTWGHLINKESDKRKIKEYYRGTVFVKYCLSLFLLTPTFLLVDKFICSIWLRDRGFLISEWITLLIILDIFMSNLAEADFIIIQNTGMFREEKKIAIIAMATNIVMSIFLVEMIGIEGIFIGTDLAVIVYWVLRNNVVNKKYFNESISGQVRIWRDNLIYLSTFVIVVFGLKILLNWFKIGNEVVDFLLKGILIELILAAYMVIVWGRSERYCMVKEKVVSVLRRDNKRD